MVYPIARPRFPVLSLRSWYYLYIVWFLVPGALARQGFSWESIPAINPRIVYAAFS